MTGSGLSINNYQLPYQLIKPAALNPESGKPRQEVAVPATAPATQQASQQDQTSVAQQAFLSQLMDQMLANRIGLDKQKFDELTEKIKETEAEKEDLLQKPPSASRDNQLAALDAKLEQLVNAKEALLEQANRNREQQERVAQAASDVIAQYRNAAFGAKSSTLFL